MRKFVSVSAAEWYFGSQEREPKQMKDAGFLDMTVATNGSAEDTDSKKRKT